MADPDSQPPAENDRPTWHDRHLWQIQPIRDGVLIAAIIGLVSLGAAASIVTVPLLLALLFAYLFEPLIERLQQIAWITRRRAVIMVLSAVTLLIVAPIALGLATGVLQVVRLSDRLATRANEVLVSVDEPASKERLEALPEAGPWRWIRDQLVEMREDAAPIDEPPENDDGEATNDADQQESAPAGEPRQDGGDASPEQAETTDGEQAGPRGISTAELILRYVRANAQSIARGVATTGQDALAVVAGFFGGVFSTVFTLFLTGFFFFFAADRRPRVVQFGKSLVPEARRERVFDLAAQMDRVVSGFVRGRLTIAAILGVFFTIGYAVVGVPAALLIGIATGVLAVIPYAALVSLPVSMILLWLEGRTGIRGSVWWVIFAPIVVYNIGQWLDEYVLTPVIQGKETDLDMPTILIAVLAGGAILGFYGFLIAIPLAACLKILIREVLWPRYKSWAAGENPDFLPLE